MPALNFTRFVDQVEDGRKTQTIRATRKRPIKVGDKLHLFTGMRRHGCRRLSPSKGVECYYTADIEIRRDPEGVSILVDARRYFALAYALISDDGFEDAHSFFDYFVPKVGDVFKGQIIRWFFWGERSAR